MHFLIAFLVFLAEWPLKIMVYNSILCLKYLQLQHIPKVLHVHLAQELFFCLRRPRKMRSSRRVKKSG